MTGGYGFVGAQLCRLLVGSGAEVSVLDDLSVGSAENLGPSVAAEVRSFVEDVRDLDAVERTLREARPAVVFHLAAVHFIPTCENHPTLAVGVNVGGTQAVLEACSRSSSVESVVVASSGAVYAPQLTAHREDDALGPTDIYGLTKLWSEQLGTRFHTYAGISMGIARIFNVVGPGETNPHLLPAIIEQIRDGTELRLGNLTTRRDYVFSGDVAEGLVRLAGAARAGSAVVTCNLGSESALSGDELVEIVARTLGRDVSVVPDPARFRESDRPVLLSDCSRARDVLGWRVGTSIEQAVALALDQPFAVGYVPA